MKRESPKKFKIIVVLGPTASGKSELAVQLAQKFNGEVVSADSRQVYRGLDIGTGKIPRDKKTERPFDAAQGRQKNRKTNYFYHQGIRHHLIDVVSPRRVFTAADYQRLAKRAIKDILGCGKLPIICGGTGFYIDAVVYDYPLPKVTPQKELRRKLENKTAYELYEELRKLDPERAENIDVKNKRRLIRALEIVISTGLPVQKLSERKSEYNFLKIGIKKSPDELKKLIRDRLMKRLEAGMIEEVERLNENGLSWERLDELGLEYRYVSRYLRGILNKERMIDILNKEIWRYAKRQMTWFRRDKEIFWVENYKGMGRLAEKFMRNVT